MSDRMTPIPFGRMLDWMLTEYAREGTCFGVPVTDRARLLPERPVGPAAGPHTQLAQNLVAAYVAGARYFELKTVQVIDGEDLPVSKPCILAAEEGYNVEWSTELTVEQAMAEYIKAWAAIHVICREWRLGRPEGFTFNMSVGYDLEGIQSPKLQAFLSGLKDARGTLIWNEVMADLEALLPRLERVGREELAAIPSRICSGATLSTLHGCPPAEIERIAAYLLCEQGLDTYVKCNPTLLGYPTARAILDGLGYDYVAFDDHHFREDLQLEDAVPMLERLQALARRHGRAFGVKLTNTFPVDVAHGELPGQEMYMSGQALYPLTLAVAERLSRAFDGGLPISYSGGADAFTAAGLYRAGIRPITMATTLLKPGGYRRLTQVVQSLADIRPPERVSAEAVSTLAWEARTDPRREKPSKPAPGRKLARPLPLLDCFTAPCKSGCPIGQDIPEYLRLVGSGDYAQALRVILDKNPLPHITGVLCPHRCTDKCMRGWYEAPVSIRQAKRIAAQRGWTRVLPEVRPRGSRPGLRAAVVGGGPGGMAAAFLLAREGASVTLFEQRDALGGVIRHVIPEFRISQAAIEADASLLDALGVEVRLNTRAPAARELLDQGFTHVVLTPGAWRPLPLELEGDAPLEALDFLARLRRAPEEAPRCRRVAVVGGGNTAMDAARAARRLPGVEQVSLIYRRTRRYMPADQEELDGALAEGVALRELLSPLRWAGGVLTCRVMELDRPDASGRRGVRPTDRLAEIPADLVVAAVGQSVDPECFAEQGIPLTGGRPAVNPDTLEVLPRVYLVGDGRRGPATAVEAIADAAAAARAILGGDWTHEPLPGGSRGQARAKRGVLRLPGPPERACDRCLDCAALCETCCEVCPNRANVMVGGQVLHLDALCNECGNCAVFCPWDGAPYRDKFTLFATPEALEASENQGFAVLDREAGRVRVRLEGRTWDASTRDGSIPRRLGELMDAVLAWHGYLL